MMAKLKELGNRIGKEEKDRIMEEFRGTLLDFCESCVTKKLMCRKRAMK
jgi:hypothetical protein